jgi:N6-adenosine-specific RNA methylase IME4
MLNIGDIDGLARAIAAAWTRGVAAILETATLVAQARDSLPDDGWSELIARLPFGPRHAQMLTRIGSDPRLTRHVSALPSDIHTLNRLASLSDERFGVLLAAETINPAMDRGDLDTVAKADARADKERDLGVRTKAANAELLERGAWRKYNVLYADPPWKFETFSAKGTRKAPNYPTMTAAEIGELAFGGLAAPDCALFLWSTVPMLRSALEVLEGWGFVYKSSWSWTKEKITHGYWNRNRHEILLLGTRGAIPAPAQGTQADSVFEKCTFASGVAGGKPTRGNHSEKPLETRAMIEAYFPSCPKIELFARGPSVEGWDLWGNEAPDPPAGNKPDAKGDPVVDAEGPE